MKILNALIASGFLVATGSAALAAPFIVTYEKPGVVATTTVFDISSVETFNTRDVGISTFDSFSDLKPGFVGTYNQVNIKPDDKFGGAGTGEDEKYGVAGLSEQDVNVSSYSLELSEGVNYFGYWLSALDPGNFVQFWSGDDMLFEFSPGYFETMLETGLVANADDYLGNPFDLDDEGNRKNSGEYYAFLNFYAQDDLTFDRIVFYQSADRSDAGYESDNHTIGMYLETGGEGPIPTDVPAPGALALFGFGLLGLGLRRRRAA